MSAGELFSDLTYQVSYLPGAELFCRLFVFNPTDMGRNYMLMGKTSVDNTVISEIPIKVNGKVWFGVEAGQKRDLQGIVVAGESNALLTIYLYEQETGEAIDLVQTFLVIPSSGSILTPIVLPPPEEEIPSAEPSMDMNALLPLLIMFLMAGLLMPTAKELARNS